MSQTDFRLIELPEELSFPVQMSDSMVGMAGSNKLMAVDLNGRVKWHVDLTGKFRFGSCDLESCFVYRDYDVLQIDHEGKVKNRFSIDVADDEAIGALAVDGSDDLGGVFLSVYRKATRSRNSDGSTQQRTDRLSPRVIRCARDGSVEWETRVPISKIAFNGCVQVGVETGGKIEPIPAWNPATWMPYGRDQMLFSGSSLLATFSEMPRTGIGCRYVIDKRDGQLLAKTKAGPVMEACPIGVGGFLMGNLGYGAFETEAFEDGKIKNHAWKSHGRCLKTTDGRILSVQTNTPSGSPQRCVLLLDDGSLDVVSRQLDGFYTSNLIQLDDGNVYFWRADQIWCWDKDNNVGPITKIGLGDGSYTSAISLDDQTIGFNIRNNRGANKNKRLFAVFNPSV